MAIRTAPEIESDESETDAADIDTLQHDDGNPDAPLTEVVAEGMGVVDAEEDFIVEAEDDPEDIFTAPLRHPRRTGGNANSFGNWGEFVSAATHKPSSIDDPIIDETLFDEDFIFFRQWGLQCD